MTKRNAVFCRRSLLCSLIVLSVLAGVTASAQYAAEAIWFYDSDLTVAHVETADINGDGIPDIITAEYDGTYYGDPSLVMALDGETGDTLWTYQLEDGVRSVTVGDITNDGIIDIIAGASYNSSGTPDGYVHAIDGTNGKRIWRYYVGTTINDVTVGNFNGDVYNDVAVASFDDYLYGIDGLTGTQLWQHYIGSLWVNAVDAGDVNDDGIDDVAYAHEYLTNYDNFFGVLNGSDGTPIWDSTVAYVTLDILVSDIDNDGDAEVIVGGVYGDDHGEVFVRNGLDGALEWSYNLGSLDHTNGEITLQDLDISQDGEPDLMIGNRFNKFLAYAFEGSSDTPLWISDTLSGYPRNYALGDVTGDGRLNVIAATYDRVQVLDAEDGAKVYYYSVAGRIEVVRTGDFDDDGIMDIAAVGGAEYAGNDPGKSVWALRTIQSPLLWEFDFGEYGNAIALGDLNSDDCQDVVAVCSIDDQAWAIDGRFGVELWNFTETENLFAVTTGDFDNEGIVDVAVGGYANQVTALDGKNADVLWNFSDPGDDIYRKCLKSTDLNADGNVDVIAGAEDNYVYALRGENGDIYWSQDVGGEVNDVELAQMDGTGPLDVVVATGGGPSGERVVIIDGSDGEILWYYDAGTSVDDVEALDADNDGVMDVALGTAPYSPRQVILVNGITHTADWTVSIDLASGANGMGHGDVNDDGYEDVLVPGGSTDKSVYALSGIDGGEIWSYLTGGEVNCVRGYDVDADGIIEAVVGSDDQNVYVLNGLDGTVEWNYSTADDVMDLQIGDLNGNGRPNIACVTFGSDGIVYAFRSLAPILPDTDGDGVFDPDDNCPTVYNPAQEDDDFDDVGDFCDNCPFDYNPGQEDFDDDGRGDVCDNCPEVPNPSQEDADLDMVGDPCDNCPDVYNPGQEDENGNDIGDACEYICGDVNDDDAVNLLDILYLIDYLYGDPAGNPPDPMESGDVNSDYAVNLLDILYLIDFLYGSPQGPEPNCP